MISKEKLLEAMKTGNIVHNHVWWFLMYKKNGKIIGGCSEPDCCQLEYSNFDEMYENYDEENWEI